MPLEGLECGKRHISTSIEVQLPRDRAEGAFASDIDQRPRTASDKQCTGKLRVLAEAQDSQEAAEFRGMRGSVIGPGDEQNAQERDRHPTMASASIRHSSNASSWTAENVLRSNSLQGCERCEVHRPGKVTESMRIRICIETA